MAIEIRSKISIDYKRRSFVTYNIIWKGKNDQKILLKKCKADEKIKSKILN